MSTPAPPRLAAFWLSAVALCPLASCGDDPVDPFDAARCEALLHDPANVDAYDWLKAPAPVARRPGSMTVDDALALVHQFEARGAGGFVAVVSGPTAAGAPSYSSSGFVLRLPDDPAKRLQVFRLYAELVRTNGFTPQADTGQKLLFIPWTRDGTMADDR